MLLGDFSDDWMDHVKRKLGLDYYRLYEYFRNSSDEQLFDLITVTTVFLKGAEQQLWIRAVKEIFQEEHLAYTVNEYGAIRKLVDEAFEAQRIAVLKSLSGSRYEATLREFEAAHGFLEMNPVDTRNAVRHMFDAVENLLKLMVKGAPQLNAEAARMNIRPILAKLHPDMPLRSVADKLFSAFVDWIDAAHNYRHAPGQEVPTPPPMPIAVAFLSTGAGFLRWMAEIDREIGTA